MPTMRAATAANAGMVARQTATIAGTAPTSRGDRAPSQRLQRPAGRTRRCRSGAASPGAQPAFGAVVLAAAGGRALRQRSPTGPRMGLTSMTGVPSRASRFRTRTLRPSIDTITTR